MKVLLLHAFPLDETMWTPQLSALRGFDVETPSLYALGGSSIGGWAEALLERVEGDFVAVGASMGGYVALALSRHAPERVRALVLVGSRGDADSDERKQVREAMIALLREQGVEAYRAAAPFDVPTAPAADDFIRALEALRDRRDAWDVVRGFAGPMLLVVGEHDELFGVDEARELAAAAPNGRLEVVPGAGHIVSQDAPERFNAILLNFLDQFER